MNEELTELTEILMSNDLFNNKNKSFTVRQGIRKYSKDCNMINSDTGEIKIITITNQNILKAKELDKEYFNYLKYNFYLNLDSEDYVTIVHYNIKK